MSNVYLISDLHLGHKNILKFSGDLRQGHTSEEHDRLLIDRVASTCSSKRDILYILGDVCFEVDLMPLLDKIPARKILVRGNHDTFQDGVYHKYFESIRGICTYKGFWLTHAPIHPNELRGRSNLHGHVHGNSIRNGYTQDLDPRYINMCVENLDGIPVNIKAIQDGTFKGKIK